MKVHGYDLSKHIEPAYAAPPLINGMAQKGELDGALNYWNYTARLKALNFRKVISVEDILPEIGIGKSLPLIGYVFSQKWAKSNNEAIEGFIAASNEAREILKNVTDILAIELLAACQAVDIMEPLKPGKFLNQIYDKVRELSPTMNQDRSLHKDIERVSDWIISGGIDLIINHSKPELK